MDNYKIENNKPITLNQPTGEVSLKKTDIQLMEETNIAAWVQKHYPNVEEGDIQLSSELGEQWILEEKGDKAYLSREVKWTVQVGGNIHVLEQKLKTSVEYPKNGLLNQEQALHRANFCIRLYTQTMKLPFEGLPPEGFKLAQLAQGQRLRFDFGQNVFGEHTVVKVYNPAKGGAHGDYVLSMKLRDDIETVFQDSVGMPIVGTDEIEKTSGVKARKVVNQSAKEIDLKEDCTPEEQQEIRHLICEKMRNAHCEIKQANHILTKEPEKGWKGFLNQNIDKVKGLIGLPVEDNKTLPERFEQVNDQKKELEKQLTDLDKKIQDKDDAIGNVKQGDDITKKALENQKQALEDQLDELQEQHRVVDEVCRDMEQGIRELFDNVKTATTGFGKDSQKALKIAESSLYIILEKICEEREFDYSPALDENFTNLEEAKDRVAYLKEFLKQNEFIGGFQKALKEDPSLGHLLEWIDNAERFEKEHLVVYERAYKLQLELDKEDGVIDKKVDKHEDKPEKKIELPDPEKEDKLEKVDKDK